MGGYRAVAILLTIVLAGCATSAKVPLSKFTRADEKIEGFTKHFKESAFAIGSSGLCSVEVLLMEGAPVVGRNDFDIIVHDARDADVGGAELSLVARHRDEGIETSPEKVGGDDRIKGLYTASNLLIEKPGRWEMTIEVRMKDRTDTAAFSFSDVR